MRFVQEEFGDPLTESKLKLDYSDNIIWYPVEPEFDMASYLTGLLGLGGLAELDEFTSKIFKDIEITSSFSPCCRAKIGSCIYSIQSRESEYGYNRYPYSKDNELSCNDIGCQPERTCRLTIHAEIDAFSRVSNLNDKDGYVLFCSAVPCLDCAKQCVVRNVNTVIYKTDRPQPEYDRPALSWISRNSGMKFIRVID
jgi:deoxycytidylate deaminase